MDCADIQRHLSEYMDGVLDAQTEDSMGKHLSSCEACQKELESLKVLVQELETLPKVKAPDDFLEQLHDRMTSRFVFWDYIKGLSRVFKMRIPLQIATATAMAVLIFAIIYSPRIRERIPNIQVNKVHETLKEQEKASMTASAPMETKGEMPSENQDRPEEGRGTGFKSKEVPMVRESAAVRSPAPTLEKPQSQLKMTAQPPAPMTAAADHTALPSPGAPRRIELSLLLKRIDMGEVRARSYDIEKQEFPSAPEKIKGGSLNASDKAKLGGVIQKDKKTIDYNKEEKADQVSAAMNQSPRDESETWVLSPYEARKQVEALIAKVHGRVLKIETSNNTDVPIYVDAEIPENQYLDFYSELHQLGTIQSPFPTTSGQGQNPIQIRIRFVVE